MRAGPLRHIIAIQQRASTQDDQGAEVVSGWTDVVARMYAQRRYPQTQKGEQGAANSVRDELAIDWIIRDYPSLQIKSSMRVLHDGQPYEIKSVQPIDNVPGMMVLRCAIGLSSEPTR